MGKHLKAVSSGSAKTLKGIKILKIWKLHATWTLTRVMYIERRGRESQQELGIKHLKACIIWRYHLFIIDIHLSTRHVFSEFLFQCWSGDPAINKFLLPPSLCSGRKEQATDKTDKGVKYLKKKKRVLVEDKGRKEVRRAIGTNVLPRFRFKWLFSTFR